MEPESRVRFFVRNDPKLGRLSRSETVRASATPVQPMELTELPYRATKVRYLEDMTKKRPRLIPTGTCWCGCGTEVAIGSFFARGHDKVAEAALLAVEYGSSVPQLLHANGYGPGHSVTAAAVDAGAWEKCPKGCGYVGAPASVRNHLKLHTEK